MLKASAQSRSTKSLMIEAALHTLKEEGFAGATARGIATRGGFNQALIFYHYGSVKQLLLAALDATSAARLERYESALAGSASPRELFASARELYAEDLASGHIVVLAEMIAGAINDPELRDSIAERVAPWIDFARATISRAVSGTPLQGLLPVHEVAYGVVAFYVGVELLTALDGDRSRADELFAVGERFVPLLEAITG